MGTTSRSPGGGRMPAAPAAPAAAAPAEVAAGACTASAMARWHLCVRFRLRLDNWNGSPPATPDWSGCASKHRGGAMCAGAADHAFVYVAAIAAAWLSFWRCSPDANGGMTYTRALPSAARPNAAKQIIQNEEGGGKSIIQGDADEAEAGRDTLMHRVVGLTSRIPTPWGTLKTPSVITPRSSRVTHDTCVGLRSPGQQCRGPHALRPRARPCSRE